MLVVPASTSCFCCWQTLPYWSALGHSAKLKAFSSWWVPGRTAAAALAAGAWVPGTAVACRFQSWLESFKRHHHLMMYESSQLHTPPWASVIAAAPVRASATCAAVVSAVKRETTMQCMHAGGDWIFLFFSMEERGWCSLFCLWIAAPFEKES